MARTPVCARYRRVPQAHPVRRSVVHRHHIPRHVRHRPIPQRPARSAPARAPLCGVAPVLDSRDCTVSGRRCARGQSDVLPHIFHGYTPRQLSPRRKSLRLHRKRGRLDAMARHTDSAYHSCGLDNRTPHAATLPPTVYTALPCRPRNCSAPLSNSSLVPRRIPCPLFAPAGVMLLHHMHHSDIYRRRLGNVRYPERQFTRARRSWTRAHRLMDGAKREIPSPPRAHRLHRRPRQPGDYTV